MNATTPRILLSCWRQELATSVHEDEDLVTLAMEYVDAVRRAGGLPIVAPHPVDDAEAAAMVDLVDGVVLVGGQDMDPACYGAVNEASVAVQPTADAADFRLLAAALAASKPVLGVCRGLQVVNVAFGGDLAQEMRGDDDHPMVDPIDNHAHRHTIEIEAGSRLAKIYGAGPYEVGSLHHQAVGRLGDGLLVTASTVAGVVEAVEAEEHDLLAVQWHPEMVDDGLPLFVDLVERAR